MAAAIIHFDVLEFVQKAREFGVNEQFAEYEARQIERQVEIQNETLNKQTEIIPAQQAKIAALEIKEPATSGNIRESELRLQKEIKELEIKILYLYCAGFIALVGILAKGFHWF